MKELFSNVIKEVTPNKDYENDILNKTDDIIKKLNKNIKDVKVF